jgi:hypothetical protein
MEGKNAPIWRAVEFSETGDTIPRKRRNRRPIVQLLTPKNERTKRTKITVRPMYEKSRTISVTTRIVAARITPVRKMRNFDNKSTRFCLLCTP